ncbi:MAG: carboxypeptidase regulatory-like domain-containing protein, partial [bacterium]|nr:carboxypeptidase regulatory-like domain-containing protein [bacterium]
MKVSTPSQWYVWFTVEEAFSGITGQPWFLIVRTEDAVELDESYLVYAAKDDRGHLSTDLCRQPRLIAEAEDELRYLREPPPPHSLRLLSGAVLNDSSYSGLASARVSLRGSEASYTVTTDSFGRFQIENAAPGEYRADVTLSGYWTPARRSTARVPRVG